MPERRIWLFASASGYLPTISYHHGDGIISFVCKSSLSDQRRFVKDDPVSFFVRAYLGSKGWIGIRLDLDELDWDTVSQLARRAYQDIAPRKLAALVDSE